MKLKALICEMTVPSDAHRCLHTTLFLTAGMQISNPIDLFLDAPSRRLYVGSKDKKRPAVYAYDVDSRKVRPRQPPYLSRGQCGVSALETFQIEQRSRVGQ